jgi:hypothetical protein
MRARKALVSLQAWVKESVRVAPERNASNKPGGLSSIPTAAAARASSTQKAKKTNVRFLLRAVENADSMAVSSQRIHPKNH